MGYAIHGSLTHGYLGKAPLGLKRVSRREIPYIATGNARGKKSPVGAETGFPGRETPYIATGSARGL